MHAVDTDIDWTCQLHAQPDVHLFRKRTALCSNQDLASLGSQACEERERGGGGGGLKGSAHFALQILVYLLLAGQPGVARAIALCAEVCCFAPPAPLSFLASRSLSPEMNILPKGENLLFFEHA